MSKQPGSRKRFPFKRSETGKNESTLIRMLGGSVASDKNWEAIHGAPRKRKFGSDWYTVTSLHPFRTREEAKASALRLQKYGDYKYRIVLIQPTGWWVYGRLAHIRKSPGGGRTARRY